MGEFALFDQRARAPAPTIDHLLIRQNGLIFRIPVHLGRFAVDEAVLEEIEEHPLLVFVIGRVAGRDFPMPIKRQAHAFQLGAHGRDIGVGPGGGMGFVRHCRVFRRHAERVPTHGMQHIKAARPLITRHHIAHGVIAHVTHMDAPRWIGEHLQNIVFWTWIFVFSAEKFP